MSVEGIWTGEIYGPYGWENSGVYVLEHGLMIGGNDRHYSAGRYRLTGERFEADIFNYYYCKPRTIFGETLDQFEIRLSGEVGQGVIEGKICRPERPRFCVTCRFTKRTELPRSEALARAC